MKRNKRGITLIALIITIIVMLILVGVTINLSANGGLFGKTREGSKETEKWAIYDQIVSAMHLTNDGKINVEETFESFKKNFGEDDKVIKDEEKSNDSKIIFTVQGNRGTYTYTITEEKIIIGIEGTDQDDDKFSQPQITLNVGDKIPSGYYYLTNINEEDLLADLYAVNAEEYNKFPIEIGDYNMLKAINYKGSTIPKACVDDDYNADCFMDINNKINYELEHDEQGNWGWRIYSNINGNDISTTPISNLFVSIGNYNLVNLDEAFNGSKNMVDASQMQLPDTVTSMSCCFSSCVNLEAAPAKLPNSVEDMAYCFRECSKLTSAPDLPTSVTDIEKCFDACSSLNEVNYLGTLEQFKQINGYDNCGNVGFVVHCTDGDYTSEWSSEE